MWLSFNEFFFFFFFFFENLEEAPKYCIKIKTCLLHFIQKNQKFHKPHTSKPCKPKNYSCKAQNKDYMAQNSTQQHILLHGQHLMSCIPSSVAEFEPPFVLCKDEICKNVRRLLPSGPEYDTVSPVPYILAGTKD